MGESERGKRQKVWREERERAEESKTMAPKKVAKAPISSKKSSGVKKNTNPLFESRAKAFGIGQALPPKRDLTRYVKWPKYVLLQRQRRVLCKRLKVPPSVNQFTKTLDRNVAESVLKLALKYRPEDKAAKKERLLKEAEAAKSGGSVDKKKPVVVKYGINHITSLIEQKKAKLVVIAHDVDPLELVVWLPALCKKMDVPFCIVKGKARLGAVVHKKTATALCFTEVNNEDSREFSKITESVHGMYNESQRISWGGGVMGSKSQAMMKKRAKRMAQK